MTADVFRGLETRTGVTPPKPATGIDWLLAFGNELEAPARRLAPTIGDVIEDLSAIPGCKLARMSGSGATCFALFATLAEASAAAAAIQRRRPHWWVVPATLR
jgi:4-diphosphocytidyl-2-C-methyl-D-erythritol kinase